MGYCRKGDALNPESHRKYGALSEGFRRTARLLFCGSVFRPDQECTDKSVVQKKLETDVGSKGNSTLTLVRSRIGAMSKRPWWLLAVLLSMNICAVNEHEGFCPPAPPSLVAAKKNLENFKPAILEPTTLWNVERLYFRHESGAPAGARR